MSAATPIPVSVARVIPKTARRLGYLWVAICEPCRAAIVKLGDLDQWQHRDTGERACQIRQPDPAAQDHPGAKITGSRG